METFGVRGLTETRSMTWHLLDTGSIWMKEFAAALTEIEPVMSWVPEMRAAGSWEKWQRDEELADPPLRFTRFPLQRGYSRFPITLLLSPGTRVAKRLLRAGGPDDPVLVCTSPFYTPVAENWPGLVIYYLTDFTAGYHCMNAEHISSLDRRMVKVASLVCPNTERIAMHLEKQGCPRDRMLVIPNATRAANVGAEPLLCTAPPPPDVVDVPRPIAGVIGNLAANMDWILLRDAVDRLPWLSWVFVGPVDMQIPDRDQRTARQELLSRGGRVRFVGAKPYGALWQYGRTFDVAILPYRRQEPTFSGSATRFYEHLAACRPILATRGVEELLHKEPLLKLVDTASQIAVEMDRLRSRGFRDGHEETRWRASRYETWQVRARAMSEAVRRVKERRRSREQKQVVGAR